MEGIRDTVHTINVGGVPRDVNIRNIVCFKQNETDSDITCWYIYTTTGERITLSPDEGRVLVTEIINEKGDEWLDRNVDTNYIFNIVGDTELSRYDDRFKQFDVNPMGNRTTSTTSGSKKGKLKKLVKPAACIIIAGVGIVTVWKVAEYAINIAKGMTPPNGNTDKDQDKNKGATFDSLINSIESDTQKNYFKSCINLITQFNAEKENKPLTLQEATALSIGESGMSWGRNDIEERFNGAKLDADVITKDYQSGIWKLIYAYSLFNQYTIDSATGLLDIDNNYEKAYKYLLENPENNSDLVAKLYKSILDDYAKGFDLNPIDTAIIAGATYIKFGDDSTKEGFAEIMGLSLAKATDGIDRVARISATCLSSDTRGGYEPIVTAYDDENQVTDNTSFDSTINKGRAKYVYKVVTGEQLYITQEEVTTEPEEEDKEEETTTTEVIESTTSDYSTTNATTQPSTTSDYSTTNATTQPSTTSDYGTTYEYTTEAPTTTESYDEPTTSYYVDGEEDFVTFDDDSEWWLTEGPDVIGTGTKSESKGKVLVKEL